MTTPRLVTPLDGPVNADVVVPGSKSHTNRALLCAALAEGTSCLNGVLRADDTAVMCSAVAALVGGTGSLILEGDSATMQGCAGSLAPGPHTFNVGLSGTTARFLAPVLAASGGDYVLDGEPPLRARPMGPAIEALRSLGVHITEEGAAGHLPIRFHAGRLAGSAVSISGDESSQFLSGLLMAGPILASGLQITVDTTLVSAPYVDLTVRTMRDFGATVVQDGATYVVQPGGYRSPADDYQIEPDASAASYFFAAAAICGGRVRVDGLGSTTTQGDLAFADVLASMGASVERSATVTEVRGTGALQGVEVDMRDCSDTAQTLAAVAVFASTPTTVRGIGFIRRKETDRIGNVVGELRRCGIEAHEHDDGFTIVPGTPTSAVVETYDDHRMAMSFALLGLRSPGIQIADPECVSKTFPGFWDALDRLRPGN
ncbi:MAG: 3-phosphoshikimate 1-carboxyvinyltransferase [Acidimicrobiales bacterium]